MKFLATNSSFCKTTEEPKKMIAERGYELVWIPDATKEQIISENPDVIINGIEVVDKEIMDACPNLKVISHHGVGLDGIDLEYAKKKGIAVRTGKGSNTEAVADFAFCLMMACARRINEAQETTLSGVWQKKVGYGIYGKTVGIVGLGAIGKAVAKRAKGFGMEVLANDVYWDEKFAEEWNVKRASVDEIIEQSDFITLHCNLTDENKGMIGYEELKRMKRTAILVNTGRGPLIDHDGLVKAMKEELIAGAGIDVYDVEPAPVDDTLFDIPNVIHTPHVAAYTVESLTNMSMFAVQNAFEELDKLK
ncbi:MAG: phosphoglycerate dehydrogenase [Anaerovoracaceae bacterium]